MAQARSTEVQTGIQSGIAAGGAPTVVFPDVEIGVVVEQGGGNAAVPARRIDVGLRRPQAQVIAGHRQVDRLFGDIELDPGSRHIALERIADQPFGHGIAGRRTVLATYALAQVDTRPLQQAPVVAEDRAFPSRLATQLDFLDTPPLAIEQQVETITSWLDDVAALETRRIDRPSAWPQGQHLRVEDDPPRRRARDGRCHNRSRSRSRSRRTLFRRYCRGFLRLGLAHAGGADGRPGMT